MIEFNILGKIFRGGAEENYRDSSQEAFKPAHLKKLWPFIAPYWRQGLLASLTMLVSTLLALPQPLFAKYIIDDVILEKNLSLLSLIVGLLLLLLMAEATLSFLKQVLFFRFEQDVILEIQYRFIQRVLRFPKSFFDEKQTGYLMSRLSGDVSRLRTFFSRSMVEMFTNVLRFVGGVTILFFLNWKLTLLALIIVPLYYYSARFFGKITRRFSYKVMEKAALVSKNLQESISGVNLIKTFATEEAETRKIEDSLKDSLHAGLEQNTVSAFTQWVNGAIGGLAMILVLWYGAREIMLGHLTIGGFWAFNAYLAYLFGPSRFLAALHIQLQSSFAALERVFSLYQLIPEDEDDEHKEKVTSLGGHVSFRNVHFSYDGKRETLRGISFSASPGEKIALVGPTGVGKSTLINLILRLYCPQQGRILFDGRDAGELNLKSLRERMGLVSQEIFLFDNSILENIRYGKPEATDKEVIRAARLAHAHEFISQFPDGYQTKVGENGRKLSTGQKQRISIARALLKEPDIFIFDEATSALDSLTEREIKDAVLEYTRGKTTFIIAHRLSTITAVDRILVIARGSIAEEGTHEVLAGNGGLYQRMWEQQTLIPSSTEETETHKRSMEISHTSSLEELSSSHN